MKTCIRVALTSLLRTPARCCWRRSPRTWLFWFEHVGALERAAEALRGQETPRAVEAIGVIADEEAAKFLILLDVARCAYEDARVKRDQLKRTSSHIAKGIYARAADIRPADFAEVLRFVDGLRRSHYLDGPNDVD